MLSGKSVLLCVTGSIAAYKSAELASLLGKRGAVVHGLMTKSAAELLTPLTLENLTHNRVITDMFDRSFSYDVEHIALAKKVDVAVVAPATANTIAKLAMGLADDMVSTTLLACTCPKIIAPAMNTAMWENPVTRRNIDLLRELGWVVVEPDSGLLACGDTGKGKMPDPSVILQEIEYQASDLTDFAQKRILITAGPTREALDPVRFITNHSTGKMGYALAWAAVCRGADVTLVSGPVSLPVPPHLRFVSVTTAQEMFDAVREISPRQDVIIKAAAVADYRPANYSSQKRKKSTEQTEADLSLPLTRTPDILAFLGQHKQSGQFLCGFAMETENLLENAEDKLRRKNLDMICANCLTTPGAGFGVETNVLTMLTPDGTIPLPAAAKIECAHRILDEIHKRLPART